MRKSDENPKLLLNPIFFEERGYSSRNNEINRPSFSEVYAPIIFIKEFKLENGDLIKISSQKTIVSDGETESQNFYSITIVYLELHFYISLKDQLGFIKIEENMQTICKYLSKIEDRLGKKLQQQFISCSLKKDSPNSKNIQSVNYYNMIKVTNLAPSVNDGLSIKFDFARGLIYISLLQCGRRKSCLENIKIDSDEKLDLFLTSINSENIIDNEGYYKLFEITEKNQ